MTASARRSNDVKRGRLPIAILAAAAFVSLLAGVGATDAEAKKKKHEVTPAEAPAVKSDPAASSAPTPDGTKVPPSFPKTVDEAKAEAEAAKKPPEKWTDAEIADAKAHCAVVLKRIHAIAIPHEPIKEGACGAPAPIELISIGQNPEVALSPPAIVRCDLAEQLVNWFENDVQPLARKHLKSEIIKIETMSSYDCRNAYGRKTTKLSEHGLANAVDIGGFVTASAKTAEVLDDWGKPKREIAEEAAAAKEAADQAAAKTAQTGVASNSAQSVLPSAVASTAGAGTAVAGLARATIIDGMPRGDLLASSSPIGDPSRLGGPATLPGKPAPAAQKTTYVAAHPGAKPDPEMEAFLHDAHDAACRIFGTTLGPEANADHRNHFHVDMAPRKVTKICD
jgi:hypothetical protein